MSALATTGENVNEETPKRARRYATAIISGVATGITIERAASKIIERGPSVVALDLKDLVCNMQSMSNVHWLAFEVGSLFGNLKKWCKHVTLTENQINRAKETIMRELEQQQQLNNTTEMK